MACYQHPPRGGSSRAGRGGNSWTSLSSGSGRRPPSCGTHARCNPIDRRARFHSQLCGCDARKCICRSRIFRSASFDPSGDSYGADSTPHCCPGGGERDVGTQGGGRVRCSRWCSVARLSSELVATDLSATEPGSIILDAVHLTDR